MRLRAEDVRHPPEGDGTDGRREQGGGVDPGHLAGRQRPLGLQQRDDDADHEQVVGVGEERVTKAMGWPMN
jgi:hypothetical protein